MNAQAGMVRVYLPHGRESKCMGSSLFILIALPISIFTPASLHNIKQTVAPPATRTLFTTRKWLMKVLSSRQYVPGRQETLLSRTGRALQLDASVFAHATHTHPCAALGRLTLMPDGYLYACCGASINWGPDSILCAGNLERIGLPDALAGWKVIELLNDIQRMGPLAAAVAETERNRRFRFDPQNKYSDICAACRDVCQAFHNAQS